MGDNTKKSEKKDEGFILYYYLLKFFKVVEEKAYNHLNELKNDGYKF